MTHSRTFGWKDDFFINDLFFLLKAKKIMNTIRPVCTALSTVGYS